MTMFRQESRRLSAPNLRDVANFIRIRAAAPEDDRQIGDLLVRTFVETNSLRNPGAKTTEERQSHLRNVASRRRDGEVLCLELGYRMIGTVAIVRPGTDECEAWLSDFASLRCLAIDREFQGLGLSTTLLDEAEGLARVWGSHGVCLHTQRGAHGVANLYRARGYVREPDGDRLYQGNLIEGQVLHFSSSKSINS